MQDLELAKDKIMMGVERKSMAVDAEEKRRVAVHEAGHAIVGWFCPEHDPIHKVTIIPRGSAGGLTMALPEKDEHYLTKTKARSMIAMAMGGLAADAVILGRADSGVASDLRQATRIARLMVCKYGMSERLGLVSYDLPSEDDDLSGLRRTHSEATAQLIDEEVRKLLDEGREQAVRIVSEHRAALERMVEALMERETLDAEEIKACIEGTPLPERTKVKIPTWAERREKARADKSGARASQGFTARKSEPSET
jgi:cell division protease FtsH